MVSIQEKVRSKLASKIFGRLGKTVTLKTQTTTLYDERGEATSKAYTSSSITAVDYDITKDSKLNQIWGSFLGGSMFMAIPYTVSISVDDLLTVNSEDYRVDEIRINDLPENVVTIVKLNKVQQ